MKWLNWLPPYIISASPSTASCSPRAFRGSSCQFKLRWAAWLAVGGKAEQHMWTLCSPEFLGFIYAMYLNTIFHVSGAELQPLLMLFTNRHHQCYIRKYKYSKLLKWNKYFKYKSTLHISYTPVQFSSGEKKKFWIWIKKDLTVQMFFLPLWLVIRCKNKVPIPSA